RAGRVLLGGSVTDLPLGDGGVAHPPAPPSGATSIPKASADDVLRPAGARPARRDPIDARIVESVRRRNGRIIDSQEQVGGYPVRPATKRVLVVPEDPAARQRWLDQPGAEGSAPSPDWRK